MRATVVGVVVVAALSSRTVWTWAATHMWVPHVAFIILTLLLVEFTIGFLSGYTLNRRHRIRLRLDRL